MYKFNKNLQYNFYYTLCNNSVIMLAKKRYDDRVSTKFWAYLSVLTYVGASVKQDIANKLRYHPTCGILVQLHRRFRLLC